MQHSQLPKPDQHKITVLNNAYNAMVCNKQLLQKSTYFSGSEAVSMVYIQMHSQKFSDKE